MQKAIKSAASTNQVFGTKLEARAAQPSTVYKSQESSLLAMMRPSSL